MGTSELDRLRIMALELSDAVRAELARQLVASLSNDPQSKQPESDFQIRLREYVDHAWDLAARTLTVHRSR